jgi:hypothetical protein
MEFVQVRRKPFGGRSLGFSCQDVFVVDLDCCECDIEVGECHHAIVVQVSDKFVAIMSKCLSVVRKSGGWDDDPAIVLTFKRSGLNHDIRPVMRIFRVGEQFAPLEYAQIVFESATPTSRTIRAGGQAGVTELPFSPLSFSANLLAYPGL